MNYRHAAGVFLFIGAIQFVLGMLIAEFLYPGYSVSMNYISDLGATCRTTCIIHQPSASIFGMVGVGLFPETAGIVHLITSFIAFFFGGLSAIATYFWD